MCFRLCGAALFALLAGALIFWLFWMQIFNWDVWTLLLNLPDFRNFEEYRPYQTAYFLSRDGEIIGAVAREWRDVISPKETDINNFLAAWLILAVEDRRFYERDLAIDVRAIARALWEDLKAGRIVEGGSTIPQQLVKQLLDPSERRQRSFKRNII